MKAVSTLTFTYEQLGEALTWYLNAEVFQGKCSVERVVYLSTLGVFEVHLRLDEEASK